MPNEIDIAKEKLRYHQYVARCHNDPNTCGKVLNAVKRAGNESKWIGVCTNDPRVCGLEFAKMVCSKNDNKIYREQCTKAVEEAYTDSLPK